MHKKSQVNLILRTFFLFQSKEYIKQFIINIIYTFSRLKNDCLLFSKMCLCTHKFFQNFGSKTLLPFLQKGEKTAELVFFVEIELDIIANKKRYFFR